MRLVPVVAAVVLPIVLAVPADARAQAPARAGRVSVGPLVGSAPGADLRGERVPTVGVVGDVALLRVGRLGLHAGGTLEHRAGARMTGVVASAALPLHRGLVLRAGASAGGAEVRRWAWARELGWRDWRGVDAGLELRVGRTVGALVLRTGRMAQFADGCPPNADCLDVLAAAPGRARFTRVSFESRYALF